MAEIRIVRDYPQPPEQVWRALTDPELIPRWTVDRRGRAAGGLRDHRRHQIPVRGQAEAGLERHGRVRGARVRRADGCSATPGPIPAAGSGPRWPTGLEPRADGTRLTYEHTGFTGVGGLFMATLLGRVRTKMLTVGLPAVLNDMN